MTIGTLYFTHIIRSCSSRLFEMCTIWLTAKGAAGRSGVLGVVGGEVFGDLGQPFVELGFRTGIQRREGADDAGLALCQRQGFGCEMMKSGARDDGQPQLSVEDRRQGHDFTSRIPFLTFT